MALNTPLIYYIYISVYTYAYGWWSADTPTFCAKVSIKRNNTNRRKNSERNITEPCTIPLIGNSYHSADITLSLLQILSSSAHVDPSAENEIPQNADLGPEHFVTLRRAS